MAAKEFRINNLARRGLHAERALAPRYTGRPKTVLARKTTESATTVSIQSITNCAAKRASGNATNTQWIEKIRSRSFRNACQWYREKNGNRVISSSSSIRSIDSVYPQNISSILSDIDEIYLECNARAWKILESAISCPFRKQRVHGVVDVRY